MSVSCALDEEEEDNGDDDEEEVEGEENGQYDGENCDDGQEKSK